MSGEMGWGMFEVALLFFFFVGILAIIAFMYHFADWISSFKKKKEENPKEA